MVKIHDDLIGEGGSFETGHDFEGEIDFSGEDHLRDGIPHLLEETASSGKTCSYFGRAILLREIEDVWSK